MASLFYGANFNGDISKWDVSNVTNMRDMFKGAKFNQDISCWNVAGVENMHGMFCRSKFNQDISRWNVSNVSDMELMFNLSQLECDLSDWGPKRLTNATNIFKNSKIEKNNMPPYWSDVNVEFLEQAINTYQLQRKLKMTLEEKLDKCNVIKIYIEESIMPIMKAII